VVSYLTCTEKNYFLSLYLNLRAMVYLFPMPSSAPSLVPLSLCSNKAGGHEGLSLSTRSQLPPSLSLSLRGNKDSDEEEMSQIR